MNNTYIFYKQSTNNYINFVSAIVTDFSWLSVLQNSRKLKQRSIRGANITVVASKNQRKRRTTFEWNDRES
ncbi:hypothetical protein BpHYR1_023793 [Brachionus plicatilis]|uniref:Uncharacterized protein n=1 Tax=Brachionus plicatilis TaxID=10195 RepID=A0A3M7QJ56_BRAPC|nr:hypothetical protein BpHYR1_023793 [Brachionus plicatilis]